MLAVDRKKTPPVFSGLVAVLCGWEFAALTTRRVPPLSHGMWRLPWWQRLLIWLVAVLIGTDHFFTRRYC